MGKNGLKGTGCHSSGGPSGTSGPRLPLGSRLMALFQWALTQTNQLLYHSWICSRMKWCVVWGSSLYLNARPDNEIQSVCGSFELYLILSCLFSWVISIQFFSRKYKAIGWKSSAASIPMWQRVFLV